VLVVSRDFKAEAAALEPLLVRLHLAQLRDRLKAERDRLPAGSVGEKRLAEEAYTLNSAIMIAERHA